MSIIRIGLLCGLPLLAPTWAYANNSTSPAPNASNTEPSATPATPSACLALESSSDRLSCYDAVFGRKLSSEVAPSSNQDSTSTVKNPDAQALPAVALQSSEKLAAQQAKSNNPKGSQPSRQLSKNSNKNDLIYDNSGEPPSLIDRTLDSLQQASSDSAAPPINVQVSLLDRRWELSESSKLGTFNLRAYKPVYLLPAFYASKKNELPLSPNPVNTATVAQDLTSIESKFQLSFKTKAIEGIWRDWGDLWLGYTQSSHWQVFNDSASRPFRETNYEPEASLIFKTNYQLLGWNGRLLGLSLNHQSNGRSQPLSRSWNRAILNIGLERDNWALMIRPWHHFSEQFVLDDNPDIEDYMGHGDIQAVYKYKDQEFALMLRHTLKGGDQARGAAQFDWSFPLQGALRGYVQVFDGYGESLINYNQRATYVGLGISLINWY